jgi:CRP/FNR family transcriptional regulator, cyclic AMP receptor protein
MRAILDYCSGGVQWRVPAGTMIIPEGGKTGHLFVLIEGRLEVDERAARSAAYCNRAGCV